MASVSGTLWPKTFIGAGPLAAIAGSAKSVQYLIVFNMVEIQ